MPKKKRKILFKKLIADAKLPETSYEGDVGLDLFASRPVEVYGHSRQAIPTGLAIGLPKGHYAEIRERSGVSLKTPLSIKAGIIDQGYRGEIKIIVNNDSSGPFKIPKDYKIAQLIIKEQLPLAIEEITDFEDETERGKKGFNSSGS